MSTLSCLILAAGLSSRMDQTNKLLLPFRDRTVLECVVQSTIGVPLGETIVVTGHQDRQIRAVLAPYPVRVAYNPEFATGISSSIRRGVLAAAPETGGYMILLGDMPLITTETIATVAKAATRPGAPPILVATMQGRHGHPVVFAASFREALLQLQGDVGARGLIAEHDDWVAPIEVDDPGIFQDIDTRSTYNALYNPA